MTESTRELYHDVIITKEHYEELLGFKQLYEYIMNHIKDPKDYPIENIENSETQLSETPFFELCKSFNWDLTNEEKIIELMCRVRELLEEDMVAERERKKND
jgi:hypothetical protein